MNLVELYEQTPVERHQDIVVDGNKVFVRDAEGTVEEYLVQGDELWLVRSDKDQVARLKAMETDIKGIKTTIKSINTKVGL
ncbi:hypothetical protein LCGC14_0555060 [marine sediment metagenome]|uniref:Uncharacterized protein n=1 Tax=marine sediment metagenome TaxID=412755 RepID=A0A0F9RNM5_9ZZZZ